VGGVWVFSVDIIIALGRNILDFSHLLLEVLVLDFFSVVLKYHGICMVLSATVY